MFHINDIANENGHTIIDVSTSVCHVEVSLGVPGPLQMRGGGWGGLPADWRYPQDIGPASASPHFLHSLGAHESIESS